MDVCPKKCIDMDENFLLSSYTKSKDTYAAQGAEDSLAQGAEEKPKVEP